MLLWFLRMGAFARVHICLFIEIESVYNEVTLKNMFYDKTSTKRQKDTLNTKNPKAFSSTMSFTFYNT